MSIPSKKEIDSAGNMVIENIFNYIFAEWTEVPTSDELTKIVQQFFNTNKVFSKMSTYAKYAFYEMIYNSVCYTINTEEFKSTFKIKK